MASVQAMSDDSKMATVVASTVSAASIPLRSDTAFGDEDDEYTHRHKNPSKCSVCDGSYCHNCVTGPYPDHSWRICGACYYNIAALSEVHDLTIDFCRELLEGGKLESKNEQYLVSWFVATLKTLYKFHELADRPFVGWSTFKVAFHGDSTTVVVEKRASESGPVLSYHFDWSPKQTKLMWELWSLYLATLGPFARQAHEDLAKREVSESKLRTLLDASVVIDDDAKVNPKTPS